LENLPLARMNKSYCFVLQYNTEALVLVLQFYFGKRAILKQYQKVCLIKVQASPIPQLDGSCEEKRVTFTFVSEYGEEDILHALSETFPETVLSNTTLVSRVRPSLRSAEHHCIVELLLDSEQNQNSFTCQG
jgi:hypothetical protein